jgi:hypothetical protein
MPSVYVCACGIKSCAYCFYAANSFSTGQYTEFYQFVSFKSFTCTDLCIPVCRFVTIEMSPIVKRLAADVQRIYTQDSTLEASKKQAHLCHVMKRTL